MIFEILMCGMESGVIDGSRNPYQIWELSKRCCFSSSVTKHINNSARRSDLNMIYPSSWWWMILSGGMRGIDIESLIL